MDWMTMMLNKTVKTVGFGGIALLALTACSSSNDSGSDVTDVTPMSAFQTLGVNSATIQNRVSGLPGSAFDAVPASGSANFTGTGVVTMVLSETDDLNFRAIGDADVTVNFGNGTDANSESISGGLSNLTAAVGTEAQVNAGSDDSTMLDVEGEIALSRLNIYTRADDSLSNRFGVSYGGTLTADGTDYVVAGRQEGGEDVTGGFDGNRFNGTFVRGTEGVRLRSIQIEDQSDTFATVGEGDTAVTYEGSIGIYGENR
ncbi:hypothetical protein [Yoonia sp. 208BN28-4]|uniref:hypothetical protein n=1 Tax=Yoonia sp. 208BN28-4 TaxID=3126505 RepID=UPI0030AEAC4E